MFHANFGDYIKDCKKYAKDILKEEIDLTNKTQLQKCEAIINYVKSTFDWNNRNSYLASKSAKDFYNQKSGNSAEINLFLLSLLKEFDITAFPVILSTRSNGKIYLEYPFESFFNDVVVMVDIENYQFLSDASSKYCAFNRIPSKCINGYGLMIDYKNPKWIGLSNEIESFEINNFVTEIDIENNITKNTTSLQTTEYKSIKYKTMFQNDSIKLIDAFEDYDSSDVKNVRFINYTKNNRPFIVACQFNAAIEEIGNKILLSPFNQFPFQENKFKAKERNYPIDFTYLQSEEFNARIIIPENTKVIYLPEDIDIDDEIVNLKLHFLIEEGIINASASYKFKAVVYEPKDYNKVKDYFELIVEKFNEKIVLEKN